MSIARSNTPPVASLPREVRLIGGRFKRSKLPVLDHPGLRPTPDRVRETLFNWLGQDLAGWQVLDLFAGSGALGFEAASRGAAQVTLVEKDSLLANSLRSSAARLGAQAVNVVCQDAFAWSARAVDAAQRFDLILLDPPFADDVSDKALQAARPLLSAAGSAYLECNRACDAELLASWGWRLLRQGRAGAVHFHWLEPSVVGHGTTLSRPL
ncbi:MAG: 16S rRNA (guanine(966)-N(2))-methyltransferase RsmD [Burkholderiales bacterium]